MNTLQIVTIILSVYLIENVTSAPANPLTDQVANALKDTVDNGAGIINTADDEASAGAADLGNQVDQAAKNAADQLSATVTDAGSQLNQAAKNAGDQLSATVTEAGSQVDKAADDLLAFLGNVISGARDGLQKDGLGGAVAGAVDTAGKELNKNAKPQPTAGLLPKLF